MIINIPNAPNVWVIYLPGKPSALCFKAIVAGFRGKVALINRTLGVPGTNYRNETWQAIHGEI